MDELSHNKVARLVALAEQIIAIAQELQGDAPQVAADTAEEVANKMANRICLACGDKVAIDKPYRRGLDNAHYNHALRLMKTGKATDAELMAAGQIGPRGKTGPRSGATTLEQFDSREPGFAFKEQKLTAEQVAAEANREARAPVTKETRKKADEHTKRKTRSSQ
jgi:hypothetical protein